MYGDATVIRALARRVREQGIDIRNESDALLRRADGVAWSGLAADAMRRLAREHGAALVRCAERHDVAAEALARHAREVEHRQELIAAVERRVRHLMESAAGGLLHSLAGHVVPSALDHWLDDFEPPPHGSLEWLHVRVPGVRA